MKSCPLMTKPCDEGNCMLWEEDGCTLLKALKSIESNKKEEKEE